MTQSLAPKLPMDLLAERSILGCILVNDRALAQATSIIQAQDFFDRPYRTIFAAMQSLAAAHQPVELVTLVDELQRCSRLDEAGGIPAIAQIGDGFPRVCNVGFYAQIVRKKSVLRNLAIRANEIGINALSPCADPDEILTELEALCVQQRERISPKAQLVFRTAAQVRDQTPGQIEWVARPWVAKNCITELSGKIKIAGKTTFATHLAAAVVQGNDFLGFPTSKTNVVYLTEQPLASFRVAMERAKLLASEGLFIVLWNDAVGMKWSEIVRAALVECEHRSANLIVVDTLTQFAQLQGDAENNAGDALAAMRPWQEATARGIAVLIIRHERKSGGDVGDAGRGSSAFGGAVDILLSLRRPEGKSRPTIRTIHTASRFSETPPELTIELTGGRYVSLGSSHEVALQEAMEAILAAAPNCEETAVELTTITQSIGIQRTTAQRAIEILTTERKLLRTGDGKKGSPYRYWRPRVCSRVYGQN